MLGKDAAATAKDSRAQRVPRRNGVNDEIDLRVAFETSGLRIVDFTAVRVDHERLPVILARGRFQKPCKR